jgi:hypothetical protein
VRVFKITEAREPMVRLPAVASVAAKRSSGDERDDAETTRPTAAAIGRGEDAGAVRTGCGNRAAAIEGHLDRCASITVTALEVVNQEGNAVAVGGTR